MTMKVTSQSALLSTVRVTTSLLCVFLLMRPTYYNCWMLKSLNLWARPTRNASIHTHIMRLWLSSSWTFYSITRKLDQKAFSDKTSLVHGNSLALFLTTLILLSQNFLVQRLLFMPPLSMRMKFRSMFQSHLIQSLKSMMLSVSERYDTIIACVCLKS